MDDLVKVTILDTLTGKTAQVDDYPEMFWTESNGSCDCNRGQEGGECKAERYLIIKVEPMPVGLTLYDFNQYYPDDLIERFIGDRS